MTKMPPDGYPALQYLQSVRVRNQQIKGWTMYHRYVASKRTFTYVDHRIF